MSYFRDNIDAMAAYVPGEQPAADEKVIKLNTNENPYPPSPRAMEVLRAFAGESLRLYPDAMAGRFRQAAAAVLSVSADWILPGDGSDDLIVMIARAAAGPTRAVAYPVPTFPFYVAQGRIEAAEIVEVPYGDGWKLPVDELIAAGAAVTFVANPSTPSGTMATTQQLAALADGLAGLLVIDEAYVDFADFDALDLTRRFDNVIVLRTLSKGYSLAGLRLGFGVANPSLLEGLVKTKAIYNVSAVACAVGAAAIADQKYHNECVAKIKASREALSGELGKLGYTVTPSQANFLLVRPPAGDAERMYNRLKASGILVRYFKRAEIADQLRITIGTPAQNEALVHAMSQLLE